jgi:mono/diheme cytochrome c family protein
MRALTRSVGLVVVVAAVAACGRSVVVDPATREAGAKVYRSESCAGCHGEERGGGRLAPPLRRLARHWDEEELVRFLRDPTAFAADDGRIREMAARFPSKMPPAGTSDPEKLRALALFLLAD